ncbi:hypothetical protein QAD02_022738 [Eretmocerus hayati]|uniref:Uncharacterized protein n=1 Tax=Eretmocerus hayati TaxID=131215 RepID=A0ACC2PWD1_9HYME|nr:hypothetical protein QAD02_022738 [Eretmocerus hayati]
MISGLQIALKNAIDVIAPPATPLQDFTYHWKQLMHFYVNHTNDAKLPVETTGIPRHLNHMLEILLEEENHGDEPGPCLEYLLQHRLLELIVTLACSETPPGMRLVALSFLRRLLTRSKHPLLHHAAVYGPVQKLIVICNGSLASPIESEEIQFLLCLCFLVCKYPHVTNIINDSSNVQQESGILSCDTQKSEVERITYTTARKTINSNPLFKPLDTQAITFVNPDLFGSGKLRSSISHSASKSHSSSENFEKGKTLKHTLETSSRSNSSSQSSRSSRDVEVVSQSSTPVTAELCDDMTNPVTEICNGFPLLKHAESYDPVTAALSDLGIEEDCPSSNSDIKSSNSKHDISLDRLATPEHSKCLLLDSIKSYVNSADNTIRIRACEGIMVLASLDDPFFAEVIAKSDLAIVLAKRLEVLLNSIPAHIEPNEIEDIEVTWGLDSPPLPGGKTVLGCRKVAAFFMWIDFCAQLSREAHPDVSETLTKTIRVSFLEKILAPGLSSHHAILITALMTKCLKDISPSPLSTEICQWLVDSQTDSAGQNIWSVPVFHRLIENCYSGSDELIIETFKLLEELMEKKDNHVLHNLIFVFLNTRAYYDCSAADSSIASWSDEEDEREREKKSSMCISQGTSHSRTLAPSNIHRVLNCFLSLIPRQLQTVSENNYGRYMGNWEKQYSVIVKDCALFAWPLEAVTVDDSISQDSRLGMDSSRDRFYPGPFLNMLLEKVTSIPKQKCDINLQLTLLITKLALLPHPYLHEFLLNPLIPLMPGVRSLFNCLQRVVKKLMNEVLKIEGYKQALKDARMRIFDDCCSQDSNAAENSNRSKEETILLESVIITEEFCKELAAIAYVKCHYST